MCIRLLQEPATPFEANVDHVAMGIVSVYQNTWLTGSTWAIVPYFLISCSLNIILTLMITIRLILYSGPVRTGVGITGTGRLCKAIIAMFIESCALYAVSLLLYVGTWMARDGVSPAFFPILAEIQVCAFLPPQLRNAVSDSDVTTDLTGHRSAAHHSTSRQ